MSCLVKIFYSKFFKVGWECLFFGLLIIFIGLGFGSRFGEYGFFQYLCLIVLEVNIKFKFSNKIVFFRNLGLGLRKSQYFDVVKMFIYKVWNE